ncbi:hypothetical protein TNCV_1142091 [Trichonephila clavipes]|nr:hypothetical protein TNCV_1142091 [Trichonephila clavipes]
MSWLITLPRRPEISLNFPALTLTDVDAIWPDLNSPAIQLRSILFQNLLHHVISTTVAILSTRPFKGMKISPDGQRSYNICPHCTDIQHPPYHIFNCPSILVKLHYVDLSPTDHQLLCSPMDFNNARAALDAFRAISFLGTTLTKQQQTFTNKSYFC